MEKIMGNQELSSSDERILKTFLVSDLTGEILGKKRNDFGGIFWVSRIPASIPGRR
jgi:hypothetical protein